MLADYIDKIKSNKFAKSIITLMSGTVLAQLLSFIVSPIMTRMYMEEEIGEYTLLLTAVSMFGSVLSLRYDMSIVSEKNEIKSLHLVKLSLLILLPTSILVTSGYLFYYAKGNYFSDLSNGAIAFWLFVFLFLNGINYVLSAYNNRKKEYKLIASMSLLRELTRDIVLIVFGTMAFGVKGLLISQAIGLAFGIFRQSKSLRREKFFMQHTTVNEMVAVGKENYRQPLYSVPASFANNFSYSVLNLFVNELFGKVILAYYSMSFRILGMPLTLISNNVSKAFFEKAAREYDNQGDFRKTFINTTIALFFISVPMVVILMIFSPEIFKLLFGKGWENAGLYVRYLSPMFGIRLIVSSLSPTTTICKKQNVELLLQVTFVIADIIAFVFVKESNDIRCFLIVVSALFSVIYFGYYFVLLHYSKGGKVKNG